MNSRKTTVTKGRIRPWAIIILCFHKCWNCYLDMNLRPLRNSTMQADPFGRPLDGRNSWRWLWHNCQGAIVCATLLKTCQPKCIGFTISAFPSCRVLIYLGLMNPNLTHCTNHCLENCYVAVRRWHLGIIFDSTTVYTPLTPPPLTCVYRSFPGPISDKPKAR